MRIDSILTFGIMLALPIRSAWSAATPFEILVTDGNRIARIEPTTLSYQYLTQPSPAFPVGLTLGVDGSLLAGSAWTNDIHQFNLATGQYLGVFAQNAQLPSEKAKGERTMSPGRRVVTSEPTASMTPMNSWPVRPGRP